MARRPNGRAIKKHRSYAVDEASRALNVHKGTIRRWLKAGLPSMTDQRPALILGADLIAFLDARKPKRQRCALHQAFCFTCREPRDPAYGEVEFIASAGGAGMMRALCPVCTTMMHKRLSGADLPKLQAKVAVTIRRADERLVESHSPCPNDHLETTRQTRAKTPS
ncbi:helix-turn-helix domain-containing protein [Jiella pelagia]|uniref:Helix-turn-helix domain-containing protein n=1 Tax=Jiella pelagia TaxID=2986949 RepID=A0ABY7C1J2_9HYPH|nr:helix-turn-helix domain-containing protein [Jiella pelagia]WAP69946.1 helix-turn-helix domain-containing protein [Jiella pelagia]